jgi:hypothetical protein
LVKFRGDKLFQGAIDLDWINLNQEMSKAAAKAFVFHGPKYHGVTQNSIGFDHGHALKDTVSFVKDMLLNSQDPGQNNLNLVIAGYGAGKSHLALTLASMLKEPHSETTKEIIKSAISADISIGNEIKNLIETKIKPSLVIALNGMQDFDLTSQFNKQLIKQLKFHGVDTKALDDLKPRFQRAKSLVTMSNKAIQKAVLKSTNLQNIKEVIAKLEEQDEVIYSDVYDVLRNAGTPIEAERGESLKDIINVASDSYCGANKPFSDIIIIFDEFGRYTEFATTRSQIAGSGVLQQLYEGVQSSKEKTVFIGFIQYELNSYVKRLASHFQNDIQRYITRFQSSKKYYLSSNLETLIANLIEKKNKSNILQISQTLDDNKFSEKKRKLISQFFPIANFHALWQDSKKFHEVVRFGCWPLSPFAVWLLVHLTQVGNHLQGRSALFFLSRTLENLLAQNIQQGKDWFINPVDLWSDELLEEFLVSEQQNFSGGIACSFQSIFEKYSHQLDYLSINFLRALVLVSKLGLKCTKREDAIECVAEFCGVDYATAYKQAENLQNNLSLIIWDEKFCQFELLTDSASRNEFLGKIKKFVEERFPGKEKEGLFLKKANELLPDLLTAIDCEFAELNEISSKEWYFSPLFATFDNLKQQVDFACKDLQTSYAHNSPRGRVIYCYVDNNTKPELAIKNAQKIIDSYNSNLPMIIILILDETNDILQSIAELEIITTVTELTNKDAYKNLIKIKKERLNNQLNHLVRTAIKSYNPVFNSKLEAKGPRLKHFAIQIFEEIFNKPLQFKFDAFRSSKFRVPKHCVDVAKALFSRKIDLDWCSNQSVALKNLLITLFKNCWKVFSDTGEISTFPAYEVAKQISENWQAKLDKENSINVKNEILQLCKEPYGANIVSATMLLGIFVTARSESLVIEENEKTIALASWAEKVFSKGMPNLDSLEVKLKAYGEAISEWKLLLDQWELETNYLKLCQLLVNSMKLQKRMPIPPDLNDRYRLLELRSKDAQGNISQKEKLIDKLMENLQLGLDRKYIDKVIIKTGDLKRILNELSSDNLWKGFNTKQIESFVEDGVQFVEKNFSELIKELTPSDQTGESIAKYKHHIIKNVKPNLEDLGFKNFAQIAEENAMATAKKADFFESVKILNNEIKTFLSAHELDECFSTIGKVRGLIKKCEDYKLKLNELYKKEKLKQIKTIAIKIQDFYEKVKSIEKQYNTDADFLINCNPLNSEELDSCLIKAQNTKLVFQDSKEDYEEFKLIIDCLNNLKEYHNKISDISLNWINFNELCNRLTDKLVGKFEGNSTLEVDNLCTVLKKEAIKNRKLLAKEFVRKINKQFKNVNTENEADLKAFHKYIKDRPPYLEENDNKKINKIQNQLEANLIKLGVNWLYEKYKELPEEAKKEFRRKLKL